MIKKKELISYASIYQSLLPIYVGKNITEKFGSSSFFINYILLHIINIYAVSEASCCEAVSIVLSFIIPLDTTNSLLVVKLWYKLFMKQMYP